MKKWMPISTSSPSAVQPRRSVVLAKITDSPSSCAPRLIAALSTAMAKSERYCTMFSTPAGMPASIASSPRRAARSGSATTSTACSSGEVTVSRNRSGSGTGRPTSSTAGGSDAKVPVASALNARK